MAAGIRRQVPLDDSSMLGRLTGLIGRSFPKPEFNECFGLISTVVTNHRSSHAGSEGTHWLSKIWNVWILW